MDSSTLLFIVGFFFFLGAAVIGLIWLLVTIARRTSRKDKTAPSTNPDLAEVVRLLRDLHTQDLVVEMDGNTFKTVHQLSEGQQHILTMASDVLAKWLVLPAPEESAVKAEQPVSPPPETLPQGEERVPAETILLEPISDIVPPFTEEPPAEVKPVSTQLPDVVGGILNPAPTPTPTFKSIAMQINDILQTKIVGTPFETRGITVNDAPDRGVVVTLDGEKYPGVKDVPDEEVRNLIRSAVLEWEKMSKAGAK